MKSKLGQNVVSRNYKTFLFFILRKALNSQILRVLVKSKMKYAAVPLAIELMKIRNGEADIAGFTNEDVENMLSLVCCT